MPARKNQQFPLYSLLREEDIANLRASGLSDETIRENGLYTEGNPDKIATLLNRFPDRPGKRIPEFCLSGGLVFPHYDLAENNGYAMVRPRSPRVRDGSPIQYEAPAGESSRPYFPKRSRPHLRSGIGPIHVTEGAKKALKLSQHGYAAIGLAGIWNWKKKDTEELLDDLAAVQWTGRVVYIVYDYDPKAKTRWNVQLAAKRLARALRRAGAREVYIVELPPGSGGAKQGVDDFMVRHGADAYHELVSQAQSAPVLPDFDALFNAEGRTDTNNARRLVDKYAGDVRWVGPWDKFLLWDGARWKIDHALAVDLKAKDIAARIFDEIAALVREMSK